MNLIPPVVADLRSFLSNPEVEEEDKTAFDEWLKLESFEKVKGKTVAEILEWAADNLLPRLEELKAEESFKKAAGLPSEPELEDAYHWVECSLVGSPKQVEWAKSIAHKHHIAIIRAQKAGKQVPSCAKWWIENRSNIVVNLPL